MGIEKQTPEKSQAIKDMANTIENTTNPKLKELFSRILVKMESSSVAKDVEEFKKEIIKTPERAEQQIFSFLPHQMAKTSVFFPMSKQELKEENRKITRIEHETGWGKIVIEGVKLSIFEEDVFLALINIAKDKIKNVGNDYLLHINMNDIVNLLYGRSGYTQQAYDRVETALQHFQLVRFEITTFDRGKTGKERSKIVRSIGNIVASYKYNKKDKDLTVRFNTEFFVYFLESMLTNINFRIRRNLKKDGSKALLRFLSTHTQPGQMHLLTVLNAINFNTDQPLYRLRSRLQEFITELKKNKVLGNKTKVYNNDTVFFDILPPQKTLPDYRG